MRLVSLYTLNRTEVETALVGGYVKLTAYQVDNEKLIPVTDSTSYDEFLSISKHNNNCKVYYFQDVGGKEKLVAVDPDLVGTIKFIAVDRVRAELANEKFRVDELTAKLSVTEHLLDKEKANSATYESRYNKLLYDTETIPIWKFVWNRLANLYTK